jgi:hypothetical protein
MLSEKSGFGAGQMIDRMILDWSASNFCNGLLSKSEIANRRFVRRAGLET